jgi:hypothetical protein
MTFGLTRQHLLIGRGTVVEERIPLSDIVRVNLKWYGKILFLDPGEKFRCVIRTRNKTIRLANIHYRGLGRSETRDREYRRFVLSLHKLLAGRGSQVRFDAGQPVHRVIGAAGTILIPLALAASLYVWVAAGFPNIARMMPVFLMACCYGWCVKSWRMRSRKSYDPAHPPLEYFPPREAAEPQPQSKPTVVVEPDARRAPRVTQVGATRSVAPAGPTHVRSTPKRSAAAPKATTMARGK